MRRPLVLAVAAVLLGATSAAGWQRTGDGHVASASIPNVISASGNPLDGATVFRIKGCASCHLGPGQAQEASIGYPDLTNADVWAGSRRRGFTAEKYLRESIRTPDAFLSPAYRGGPPSPMPTLALSDRELDAVVAYLLNR